MSYVLAHIHCMKFVTGGYIVSPPNAFCVTTLPSKSLIMTYLLFNTLFEKVTLYFFNNC